MPDNSGDQSEPSPAPAVSQPPPGQSPAMSRVPRTKQPVVVIPKEAPPGFHEFITLLANIFSGNTGEQANQQSLPKKQKFQRRIVSESSEGDVDEGPSDSRSETDADAGAPARFQRSETSHTPAPTGIKYADGNFTAARMRKAKPSGIRKAYLVFAWQVLAVALVVSSFFLGRATVRKPPVKSVAEQNSAVAIEEKKAAISKIETLQLVDRAMAAEASGDARTGFDLLQKISDSGSHVIGLDFHMALLAYEADDLNRVLPLLNRAIAAGEEAAASYNLRGTMTSRQGGVGRGLNDLEMATQVDPFEANHFFFLGEAQRRAGRPQTAILTLQRALDRQRDQNLTELYQLKIRLAQIEASQEDRFTAELSSQLAAPRPALNWLFTAAALEMHRGNFDAAARYLDKAHERTDDFTMNSRLRDFYFVGFAREKPLERFFTTFTSPPPPPKSIVVPASTPAPTPSLDVLAKP